MKGTEEIPRQPCFGKPCCFREERHGDQNANHDKQHPFHKAKDAACKPVQASQPDFAKNLCQAAEPKIAATAITSSAMTRNAIALATSME